MLKEDEEGEVNDEFGSESTVKSHNSFDNMFEENDEFGSKSTVKPHNSVDNQLKRSSNMFKENEKMMSLNQKVSRLSFVVVNQIFMRNWQKKDENVKLKLHQKLTSLKKK